MVCRRALGCLCFDSKRLLQRVSQSWRTAVAMRRTYGNAWPGLCKGGKIISAGCDIFILRCDSSVRKRLERTHCELGHVNNRC